MKNKTKEKVKKVLPWLVFGIAGVGAGYYIGKNQSLKNEKDILINFFGETAAALKNGKERVIEVINKDGSSDWIKLSLTSKPDWINTSDDVTTTMY